MQVLSENEGRSSAPRANQTNNEDVRRLSNEICSEIWRRGGFRQRGGMTKTHFPAKN